MSTRPKFLATIPEVPKTFHPRYEGLVALASSGKRRASVALQHVYTWDLVRLFQGLGMDEEQSYHATANSYVETGAGAKVCCNNAFGVKVKPSNVQHRAYFADKGHVESGDAEEVLYVAFRDMRDGATYWAATYVPTPKPGAEVYDVPKGAADYEPAGAAFHRVGGRKIERWFEGIIDAEYKGTLTKTIPERRAQSIATFMNLVNAVRSMYERPFCGTPTAAQDILAKLGYYAGKIDGTLGPKSQEAIRRAQLEAGLPQTGTMNPELGKFLLRRVLKDLPPL